MPKPKVYSARHVKQLREKIEHIQETRRHRLGDMAKLRAIWHPRDYAFWKLKTDVPLDPKALLSGITHLRTPDGGELIYLRMTQDIMEAVPVPELSISSVGVRCYWPDLWKRMTIISGGK